MLHHLKTFLSFNAFCSGCERYSEMLVAMGLAPQPSVAGEQIPTDTAQSGISSLKALRRLPVTGVTTPLPRDIFHSNL